MELELQLGLKYQEYAVQSEAVRRTVDNTATKHYQCSLQVLQDMLLETH